MADVKFGLFPGLHPPLRQIAMAERAEALGYDSIWAGDHISFYHPLYEPLTLLAFYAARTTRITIGTSVYLLALRHPTVVAKITSTLDALSNGRLIFGVGVGGENPKEFEASSVPYQERGARVNEGIQVLRALWSENPASFSGRFVKFDSVSIDPKPAQPGGPPIWIGGRSDAALRRAGRLGDGWVSYLVTPDRFRLSMEKARSIARETGRDPEKIEAAHLAFITVAPDWESARRTAARLLTERYRQDFSELTKKYCILGTPAQCVESLQRFVEAGASTLILSPICDSKDEMEQAEIYAREILPRFRRR